jgi:hypothetical protein
MISYKIINHPEFKYELTDDLPYILDFNIFKYLEISPRISYLTDFMHAVLIEDTQGNCYTRFELKRGFKWNGANAIPDYANTQKATALHDALYFLIEEGTAATDLRAVADKRLYQDLRKAGFSWWRAGYWYLGVRMFGWKAI